MKNELYQAVESAFLGEIFMDNLSQQELKELFPSASENEIEILQSSLEEISGAFEENTGHLVILEARNILLEQFRNSVGLPSLLEIMKTIVELTIELYELLPHFMFYYKADNPKEEKGKFFYDVDCNLIYCSNINYMPDKHEYKEIESYIIKYIQHSEINSSILEWYVINAYLSMKLVDLYSIYRENYLLLPFESVLQRGNLSGYSDTAGKWLVKHYSFRVTSWVIKWVLLPILSIAFLFFNLAISISIFLLYLIYVVYRIAIIPHSIEKYMRKKEFFKQLKKIKILKEKVSNNMFCLHSILKDLSSIEKTSGEYEPLKCYVQYIANKKNYIVKEEMGR